MRIKDIMHKTTVVKQDATVLDVAKIMDKKEIGSVLVETKVGINGILTERDILKKVVAKGLKPSDVTVKRVMTRIIKTINENADIVEAGEIFEKHHIRRLPVTNASGRIVGMITIRDIGRSIPYALRKFLRSEEYRGAVVFSKDE